jgi:hypothetical protein
MSHGKRKTVAFAAFLGDSAFYRQKETDCCRNATIFEVGALIQYPFRGREGRIGRQPNCLADGSVNNSRTIF